MWCKEQAEIISERRLYSAFAEREEWKRKVITNERLREDRVLWDEAQVLRKARLRVDIEFMAAKEARQQKRLAFQKERLVRQREHLAAKVAGVETRFQERTRAMAEGNGRTNGNANAPTPTPTPTPTPFAGHRITNQRLREDAVLRDEAQELRKARLREDIEVMAAKEARHQKLLFKLEFQNQERTRVMAEGNANAFKEEAQELKRMDNKAYAEAVAFLQGGPAAMRVAGKRKRQLSRLRKARLQLSKAL